MNTKNVITLCLSAFSIGISLTTMLFTSHLGRPTNPLDKHDWDRFQIEASDPDNAPYWSSGKFYSVSDGDTVSISVNWQHYKTYALTGINAPDSGEAAEASKLALYEKLKDKRVYVHWDDIEGGVEYATLFVDGVNINKWMLDNGYAEAE